MKNLSFALLCVCASIALASGAEQPALEPPATPNARVTAECQIITLPQKIALALLPELADDAKIERAFTHLQELIAKGEAHLVAAFVVKSEMGKKATSEAIEELRYPTEWEPPMLPNVGPNDNAVELLKNWPLIGFTPTAFETRNLGPRLEIEPLQLSSDGRSVEVAVTLEHVRFLRSLSYDAGTLATGERLSIEQPQFQSSRTSCTIKMRDGERAILGVHKVAGDAPVLEIFLLRTSIKLPE